MTDDLNEKRHLDLEGTFNTRDIGGYATEDGRRIRWGRFLRSDSLHQLPIKSQAALLEYGVRTIIDLRRSQEIQIRPNVFYGFDEVAYYHQNSGRRRAAAREGRDSQNAGASRADTSYLLRGSRPASRPRYTKPVDPGVPRRTPGPCPLRRRQGQDRLDCRAGPWHRRRARGDNRQGLWAYGTFPPRPPSRSQPGLIRGGLPWEDYQRASCPPKTMLGVLPTSGRPLRRRRGLRQGHRPDR